MKKKKKRKAPYQPKLAIKGTLDQVLRVAVAPKVEKKPKKKK